MLSEIPQVVIVACSFLWNVLDKSATQLEKRNKAGNENVVQTAPMLEEELMVVGGKVARAVTSSEKQLLDIVSEYRLLLAELKGWTEDGTVSEEENDEEEISHPAVRGKTKLDNDVLPWDYLHPLFRTSGLTDTVTYVLSSVIDVDLFDQCHAELRRQFSTYLSELGLPSEERVDPERDIAQLVHELRVVPPILGNVFKGILDLCRSFKIVKRIREITTHEKKVEGKIDTAEEEVMILRKQFEGIAGTQEKAE